MSNNIGNKNLLKITQVRSSIGVLANQSHSLSALGLRKIGSVVERENNSSIQGLIKKVSHLVKVETL
jgi:large subunit ribosomal protein L30